MPPWRHRGCSSSAGGPTGTPVPSILLERRLLQPPQPLCGVDFNKRLCVSCCWSQVGPAWPCNCNRASAEVRPARKPAPQRYGQIGAAPRLTRGGPLSQHVGHPQYRQLSMEALPARASPSLCRPDLPTCGVPQIEQQIRHERWQSSAQHQADEQPLQSASILHATAARRVMPPLSCCRSSCRRPNSSIRRREVWALAVPVLE